MKRGDDKEKISSLKKALPIYTFSGTFTTRLADKLVEHSGFVIADLDYNTTIKAELTLDPYVAFCFTSCSGRGLAIGFQVDPERHREGFRAIANYMKSVYSVEIDPTQDVNRARYVSYDPELYENIFCEGLPIDEYLDYAPENYTVEHNPEWAVSEQICLGVVELVKSRGAVYEDGNRNNFLFRFLCIANRAGVSKENMALFLVNDPQFSDLPSAELLATFEGAYTRLSAEHGKQTPQEKYFLEKYLFQFKPDEEKTPFEKDFGHSGALAEEIDDKIVSKQGKGVPTKKAKLIYKVKKYLIDQYNVRYNEILGTPEIDGEQVDDRRLNQLWLSLHERGYNIDRTDLGVLLNSNSFPSYNPFHEFIDSLPNLDPNAESLIYKLASSINQLSYPPHVFFSLIKKWFVGVVAGCYEDNVNELELVLLGPQYNGKTWFFRNLLPEDYRHFYAENKLDGDDAELILCRFLIVMDDEYGGKSKREAARHKSLVSKSEVTMRVKYGKYPQTFRRYASLCGTSNEKEILSDPSGNRRVIPVWHETRDFRAFDSIDKSMLWAEAAYLYNNGYDFKISKEEIKHISNEIEVDYSESVTENELIIKHFLLPSEFGLSTVDEVSMTTTDILKHIQMKNPDLRISPRVLGRYLRKLGFEPQKRKVAGTSTRVYIMKERF